MITSLILHQVAIFLGLDKTTVQNIANNAPYRYKRYTIPKRNGCGKRIILHPSQETKAIQYAIFHILLNKLTTHASSYAYRKGLSSPLRSNAEQHRALPFTIRIDFKDFFPSLRPNDLYTVLEATNKTPLSSSDKMFLARSLFFPYKNIGLGLPIGAPTSPSISNAVLYDLDIQFTKAAKSINPKSVYTRYADDINFSSDTPGDCHKFLNTMDSILSKSTAPTLNINKAKTIFLSKKSRRQITGLVVTPDGKVSLGRERKRYIKKLAFDYISNRLPRDQRNYLKGLLAFALDNDPMFYHSLIIKYGDKINTLLKEKMQPSSDL
ncbi:MAG TPA: retron St85 family RNA-directed DNA polymerase [Solidesulfovibrio magneticus]|nr:retron St85 family RNA-directed DNA polymerase [Solidesulfovibrio magneticus]